jgi:type IV pilus assembly protein PilV
MRQTHMKKSEKGFSLIEVLITMIILAVGLLAIASLQFKGLQYSSDAYMRSHSNILAFDIIDRIRINGDNVGDYIDKSFVVPLDCASNTACDVCSATLTTAANDLECWHAQVALFIPPTGTANITETVLANEPNEYTVTIGWTGRDTVARTIAYSFTQN